VDSEVKLKILLIGDSGVGKTSMLVRFTDNTFSEPFISTIGVDFRIKTISIGGKTIKLQLWDTAGQDRFRSITNTLFRGTDGILMIYDITHPESFTHIQYWISQIDTFAPRTVRKMLVGNKCDMTGRQVMAKQAKELADELNIEFMETSAKSATGLDDVFIKLATSIVNKT